MANMGSFNCIKIGTMTDEDGLSNLFSNSNSNETFIGLCEDDDGIIIQTTYHPHIAGIVELYSQLNQLVEDLTKFGATEEMVKGNISVADAIEDLLQHPGTWVGSIYQWLLDWSDEDDSGVISVTPQWTEHAGVCACCGGVYDGSSAGHTQGYCLRCN